MNVKNNRLIKAVVIIFLLFIVLMISVFYDKAEDVFKMLNVENENNFEMPKNFQEEFGNIYLMGAKNVKVSDNKKIIGFELPYDQNESFSLLRKKLEESNWFYVNSGVENAGSFTKKEGIYQWALINCINVTNTTSVVITLD